MGYIVRMPSLGMQMDLGEVIEWFVEEGDDVEAGDVIAEIESEKATAEIEASEDGRVRHVFVDAGGTAEPGSPLGIVAGADEDISGLEAEVSGIEIEIDDVSAGEERAAEPEPASDAGTATTGTDGDRAEPESGEVERGRVTPRARRRAEEVGVELATVEGTGPSGAITVADVEGAAAETSATGDAAAGSVRGLATPRARRRAEELGVDVDAVDGSAPNSGVIERDVVEAATAGGPSLVVSEERTPSGMRQTIARRLGESYREAVHVTETREVDAETLLAAASAADEALEVDVSVSDVLLRVVSETLAEHPEFNARFEDGVHRLYEQHNIATAVDVEDGLVTPVLRDVGSKPLSDLAAERRAITDRTLDGDYTMDDLSEGTFTISNLGVLGVDSFTPIINPPQVAILGVGRARPRATQTAGGGLEFRRHIVFSLSFDHRVVDGADAARFLATLSERAENAWSAVIG